MELKPPFDARPIKLNLLLIVPYGIETIIMALKSKIFYLLIVPYGIETSRTENKRHTKKLLIVPYGIETQAGVLCTYSFSFF